MYAHGFIYLDNNATTPLDPRVLEAMMPYLTDNFANAASTHHFGQKANLALKKARKQVADLLNCDSTELIFTSGATEAINLALKGLVLHPNNTKKHIITVQTEHKAVLDTCKYLETLGIEITYLPVNSDGLIDLDLLDQSIRPDTLLVAIMYVNNETGVIQDVQKISKIIKNKETLFFCDATQALGKIPMDVYELGIDLLACSAHKFYGPKGAGALYINSETVGIRNLQSFIHGGGHESGLRSGTSNMPALVGFGKACELANQEMAQDAERIQTLRNQLETKLLQIEGAFINGHSSQRLYNTLNIGFPDFDANVFIGMHKTLAVSNGSACTSAIVEASHVLKAMGLTDEQAFGSLRISLGRFTTQEEIQSFTQQLKAAL